MHPRLSRALTFVIFPFFFVGFVAIVAFRICILPLDMPASAPGTSVPSWKLRLGRTIAHVVRVVLLPLNLVLFPVMLVGVAMLTILGITPRSLRARREAKARGPAAYAARPWASRDAEDRRNLLMGLTVSAWAGLPVGGIAAALLAPTSWGGHGWWVVASCIVGTQLLSIPIMLLFGGRVMDSWTSPGSS
ncbi:MAG TPA: hypothetical protein VFI52_10280 [Gemmatimonadaceae bacterium]|nr:hypothetical protein [Gemmatimonadaceae bacterium]